MTDARPPATPADLRAAAAAYAETVPIDVDRSAVRWEVSRRAKRRAGACLDVPGGDEVVVRLSWDAYEEHGWEECTRTIRHELVHVWQFQTVGEADHGPRFAAKAAELDAPRHCSPFTDPRLRLVCRECPWEAGRHRAARTVTDPGRYVCGECGAPYVVEHAATGERWDDAGGYEAARERIGDRW